MRLPTGKVRKLAVKGSFPQPIANTNPRIVVNWDVGLLLSQHPRRYRYLPISPPELTRRRGPAFRATSGAGLALSAGGFLAESRAGGLAAPVPSVVAEMPRQALMSSH